MSHKRSLFILLALLAGVLLLVVGCTQPLPAPPSNPQATIEGAVQATLTAVAVTPAPAAAVTTTPETVDAGPLILPPIIPNFKVNERAESTKGDANAPVVMYEWSDYT